MKRAHVVIWLVIAGLLTACMGTRSAYHEARAIDEAKKSLNATASVVGEHYYALVREAADAKDSGALTGSKLAAVQAADVEAKPLVIQLTNVAEKCKATPTAECDLEIQEALNQASLAVNDFINALRRGK